MSGKPRLTKKQKEEMKQSICELLQKTPIIESACQKVGISRMTLNRWRKEDYDFNQKVEEALNVSRASINDLAESKMIQKINEGNPNMIRFWLANNSNRYKRNPDIQNQFHFNAMNWSDDHLEAMKKAMPDFIKNINHKMDEN